MKQPTFKKLILDELRSKGLHSIVKKIKSIKHERYAGGSSIRVKAIDLDKKEREELETIVDSYQYGDFDGMNDLYVYRDRDDSKPSAKYTFVYNEWSEELRNKAKDFLSAQYEVTDDKSAQEKMGIWYDTAIHRVLNDSLID